MMIEGTPAESVVDDAVRVVRRWLSVVEGSDEASAESRRLAALLDDPHGADFAMRFVDLVIRPEDATAAAAQLRDIVGSSATPRFLGPVDRTLLRIGAVLAPVLPWVVIPAARWRMRRLIGHLIADADPEALRSHLAKARSQHDDLNVNLLGEAVLGREEADRRLAATIDLLGRDDVDYVSVKISAVCPELDLWAFDETVELIEDRLRPLYRAAIGPPEKFVNLDMEEYADLDLTIAAFRRLLDEDEFAGHTGGIVLQAYLPDSFPALQDLAGWAERRHARHGGRVKVRLVKGANLAMERVEAEMHGWEQAPYLSKVETDANWKRCLDWAMTPERTAGMQIGVASHNLFDVAWAMLLADRRGVADRVEFEMLQGMAPEHAELVRRATGGMRLYTPVVARSDFDAAIGYLFRRLEENSDPENFISVLFGLEADSPEFRDQEQRFRSAVARRWDVGKSPRRTQDRTRPVPDTPADTPFANCADTDPSLPANRAWARAILDRPFEGVRTPMTTDRSTVDATVAEVAEAQKAWAARSGTDRRLVLRSIADELERRRADLVGAMVHEGTKTIAQADPEVSEAVDFARYYADRATELELEGATSEPYGVVLVVPPWNFPVAIPTGGVMAALAAGNGVILKPAPEVPRCAELIHEAIVAAGTPEGLVRFIRTPDDDTGRHLVTHEDVDAVILTGSWDTADLFRSWKPDLRLFAETSGKNAIVVTPNADFDLAAADIVASAFGHAGQKCSAASLAILVGSAYDSARLRRQIVDAARSLVVAPPTDATSQMTPLAVDPTDRLHRAFTTLEPGESWLLEPRHLGGRTWTPGIRDGVRPGSWFHVTECFGPVLGLVHARDLDEALAIQNSTGYGLTGGIHSLEASEIEQWEDGVEVGNAYVNRHITGAIVRRQPFGGWKRSVVGPGAKAGGRNYVAQFRRWTENGELPAVGAEPLPTIRRLVEPFASDWLTAAVRSDQHWWDVEFGVDHDPSALRVESNVFRYRPRPLVVVRAPEGAGPEAVARVVAAAIRAGTPVRVSSAQPVPGLDPDIEAAVETESEFRGTLGDLEGVRIRHIGDADPRLVRAAWSAGADLVAGPVHVNGRLEMMNVLREQAVARTMHRYGNVLEGQGNRAGARNVSLM